MEARRKKRRKTPVLARLLAVLLAFAMLADPASVFVTEALAASVENPWDGQTLTAPATDEDGTYLIGTGAELAWFAAEVNSGRGEINGRLTDYIYLNDYNTAYNWTMIGDTEENPYRGNFDGNGQKVVYMRAEITMDDPERRFAGLFGVIDGGTVQNVTVLGKVIQGYGNYGSEDSNDQLRAGSGGIAGYLKSGQIINCVNYARTTMDGEAMYRNSGGIVGICQGLVMHCENQGKLSTTVSMAQNHIGGIAGLLYGVNAQAVNCANYATVQGYLCVGGIAGAVKSGAEINSSCNYGDVKGNSLLGGIAGRVSATGIYSNGTAKECAVRNVYNLGNISGYGTGGGTEMGGIAGQVGYENWTQQTLPPMPVIENAYSATNYANTGYVRRGAVIGYLLSGSYGTVYGRSVTGNFLNVVGATNSSATQILGEARMLTEEEMKSEVMVYKLGSAFTMATSYDTENDGYPKLVWQGLSSGLLTQIDQAQLELNAWLSEANRKKYGKNYSQIEALVQTYKEKLGAVTTEEALTACMEEARTALNNVKPGVEADNELMEAIDNGQIALEEYCKTLISEHTDLTDAQKTDLNNLLSVWTEKLAAAADVDEVRLLIRDGRDALDQQVASYEEDKRLEEIRANAIQVVTDYRAEESYSAVWMNKIKMARNEALEQIAAAETAAEVTSLMESAKNAIDAIIDQIPETGAWDGVTLTEPVLSEEGIYQITTGSELAWFASRVNAGGSGDICGELCNDVSLGFRNWTPIGFSEARAFSGSFDGHGYTVRGLFIERADTYAGLFGYVVGTGENKIQNVTVSGTITVNGRAAYAAGIVARAEGLDRNRRCQIINCQNQVSVTVEGIKTLDAGIGGVAGRTKYAELSNCANTGSVSILSEEKGGITYYAGGVAGSVRTYTRMQNCYNSGAVWSSHTAGGLAGEVAEGGSEIYSCYNTGEITGERYAGGLVGALFSTESSIDWCYTSGPVNLNQSGLGLGALFGILSQGSEGVLYALKRSDSLNRTLVGSSADFSATGKFVSEAELQGDDVLNALNSGGSCFIHDYLGFQNGYPILSWQLTLEDFKTGAISELQTFVQEADYEPENWAAVRKIIEDSAAQIRVAADMEAVAALLTQAKAAVYEIETKADAAERQLAEARNEAIQLLENYVDLSAYRDQEQTEIRQIIADAKSYILLADSIEEVERHRDEARSKIDRLPDAWQYYQQVNMAAAAQVDSYISNIGEVIFTAYVKTAIQIARSAYDSLTDEQKELVTRYQTLIEAEETWARLEAENEVTEEDMDMAAEVDLLIDAIGDVTADSGSAIQAARLAFDSLTEKQQSLVSHPETLIGAEEVYNKLRASEVIAAIAAIGTVTLEKKDAIFAAQDLYDALTEAQKALVTDYQVLQTAIVTYQNLVVAQPVIDLIDALGSVSDVTLDSGDAIVAAIQAYNMLNGDQQQLVHNYDILAAAASVYDSLVRVQTTIQLIDRIGAVSQASGQQIADARAAYDSLTAGEKKLVTNFSVLENAEAAYAALGNPQVNGSAGTEPIPGNTAVGQSGQNGTGSGSSGTDTGNRTAAAGSASGASGDGTASDGSASDGTSSGGAASGEDASAGTDESLEEALDGSLPAWLEEQLNGMGVSLDDAVDEAALLAEAANARRRKNILLVASIVFSACALLTLLFVAALRKGAGKRREKQVHY